MSLLHATWLFPPEGSGGRLLLWADTWRVAEPITPSNEVSPHPFSLGVDDLAEWLHDHDPWSEAPGGPAAGWFGGRVDATVLRLVEFMTAVPSILLALFLLTLFGHDLQNVIMFQGITGWVGVCRLGRAQFMTLRERDFVTAARALGMSEWSIMIRHVMVNAAGPIIVMFTLGIPGAIFGEAGLSFLGLGVNAPIPSWGKMVAESSRFAAVYWYLAMIPTGCIAVTMLAFSFLGDGLRDALDPQGQR